MDSPDPPPDGADAAAAQPTDADPPNDAPPEEKPPQPGAQLVVIADDISGGLNSVAFAFNGAYLVAGGAAKTWWQWQVGGEVPFALLRSGSIHNHPIYRIAPNPASSRFATIDFSGKLFRLGPRRLDPSHPVPVFFKSPHYHGAGGGVFSLLHVSPRRD